MKPVKQDIPKQFKKLSGLGKPTRVFKAKTSLKSQILVASFLLLTSGGLFSYALLISYEMWISNYYYTVILERIAPWLIAAALVFLVFLAVLWRTYIIRKLGAVVYSEGFAFSSWKGVKAWKWEQIKDLTASVVRNYSYGIYVGTNHTYTLINTRGEKMVINDSLKDVEELYSLIQDNSIKIRYQRLADRFNQGEEVNFGPVTIGKQTGLTLAKKSFSWDEIAEVSIDKGILSVKKKDGGWFSGATTTSGTIPNLYVLLSILDQVVGLSTGG